MIQFTILGEPASKANSRKIATIAGHSAIIKSAKALDYVKNALRQIPPAARQQLTDPVIVTMHIFYASNRPDLDESVIIDVLQDQYKTVVKGTTRTRAMIQRGVYINDRQVKEKHVYWGIDKKNPRAEITVDLMGDYSDRLVKIPTKLMGKSK